jgi:hypothetical protein
MMVYNFQIPTTATLATGTSIFLLIANAAAGTSRSAMITEIDFEGAGSASGFCQIGLFRLTAVATAGSTAVVGQSVDSPLLSGTGQTLQAATTGSTAPTGGTVATGGPVHSFGLNFNGQRYFWRANPNLNNAIVIPPTASPANQILVQCIVVGAGTAAPVTGRIQINEL